jgi:hypothetical protein
VGCDILLPGRHSTNLLAVTERARKLRAQYALQANDLRARIERRVNRIPLSLRKANMGELLEKHNATTNKQQNLSPSRKYSPAKVSRNIASISIDPETSAARDGRTRRARYDVHRLNLTRLLTSSPALMAISLTRRMPLPVKD